MPATTRAPRKDAVANRARILAAAAEVFRREGFGVGVEKIAREAGINVATLYRNFPSKSALILAIGESLLEPCGHARDVALASDEPGAVGRFLAAQVDVYAENRGVVDAFSRGDVDAEVRAQLVGMAIDILAPLAERGHRDGSLAAALDVQDLLVALRMITGAVITSGTIDRDPRTYAEVLARGLREPAAG